MNSTALLGTLPDILDLSVPVPPASLERARADRDGLVRLLDREHQAAADFLVALADFDRRRGWERLGHGSLFAFLTRELRLSKGAAYLRFTAARLFVRFPAVEAALRDGDRCVFPLDVGGVCGSTWQVELDHVVPLALGGETTVANLRCLCAHHNRAAADSELGIAAWAWR